jgi:hypothetical protein
LKRIQTRGYCVASSGESPKILSSVCREFVSAGCIRAAGGIGGGSGGGHWRTGACAQADRSKTLASVSEFRVLLLERTEIVFGNFIASKLPSITLSVLPNDIGTILGVILLDSVETCGALTPAVDLIPGKEERQSSSRDTEELERWSHGVASADWRWRLNQ